MAAVTQARGSALALTRKHPFSKLDVLYRELEELAERLGLVVILDKGPFTGGACILEGEELIVLNKSTHLEQRARLLAMSLAGRDLSGIYLKPVVRQAMEEYGEVGGSWIGS